MNSVKDGAYPRPDGGGGVGTFMIGLSSTRIFASETELHLDCHHLNVSDHHVAPPRDFEFSPESKIRPIRGLKDVPIEKDSSRHGD